MPSHLPADHPAAQPPGRGSVDALISQTRRLKVDVDAVRRDARDIDTGDPQGRWQRALYDLALHQLEDLDAHLAQLRDGPPPAPAAAPRDSLLSRVGSAEWNLLADDALWSAELYGILGRDPATPALTLDELPSLVLEEDRPKLTAMVTDCLVDARPIDGEFRVVRPDGGVRTVHMMGEPVLDSDGGTASMWAVLRDVSELRRSQSEVRRTRDSLRRHRQRAQSERRPAVEPHEAVPPSGPGAQRLPQPSTGTLDLAAARLPAATGSPLGGDWYDALELPDGRTLLSVGDLTGHGPSVATDTAMLLGALRGMGMAGTAPAQLMGWLNQLLDTTAQPVLAGALCCRYRPDDRTLTWAQAGHPAPLLFRGGTGCRLDTPGGVLLGATTGAVYGQAEATLATGDLLVLHTAALVSGDRTHRLIDLAPRFHEARTAQDCLRTVMEVCGESGRDDEACVLVARVTR